MFKFWVCFWQQTKAVRPPNPGIRESIQPSAVTANWACPQAAGTAFLLAWNLKCSLESVSCCCQNLASLCTYWSYGRKERVTLLLCQAERQLAPQGCARLGEREGSELGRVCDRSGGSNSLVFFLLQSSKGWGS